MRRASVFISRSHRDANFSFSPANNNYRLRHLFCYALFLTKIKTVILFSSTALLLTTHYSSKIPRDATRTFMCERTFIVFDYSKQKKMYNKFFFITIIFIIIPSYLLQQFHFLQRTFNQNRKRSEMLAISHRSRFLFLSYSSNAMYDEISKRFFYLEN